MYKNASPVQQICSERSERKILFAAPQSKRFNLNNNTGIISVVALGMFALMMYFSIIIMQNVVNRYNDVRNSLNYKQAQILADSGSEYLLWTLKKHEAGYNFTKECNYSAGETYTPEGFGSVCDLYDDLIPDKDFTLTMSLKARAESISAGDVKDENLRTGACETDPLGGGEINSTCYIVPFPGTGTANEDCKRYIPVFGTSGNQYVPANLANGSADTLDQIDYSCNWNKLKFGSSVLDRVSIPLYYEGVDADGAPIIVNPFFDDVTSLADVIGLRIRTPCRCGKVNDDGSITAGELDCRGSTDETVCSDIQRYVLDEADGDDIVVQWQINGECEGEACGIIGYPNVQSAIYESRINDLLALSNVLIGGIRTLGLKTDVDDYGGSNEIKVSQELLIMEKPILSLFLSNALIDENGDNIPYLEYQLITDHPVSNPTNRLYSRARVDGNNFIRTLTKDEPKDLIDFAVQN